jgi:glucose-6-phosphate 1-dehydrogenase
VPSYRQEDKVAQNSMTETFAAARFEIDNWRWHGVPFYLRTGKALATSFTEINIIFKRPPGVLFSSASDEQLRRNTLRIRIQPNESISLKFNAKVPGEPRSEPVEMAFSYKGGFNHYLPEAYERLIVDAMVGESTLFTRSDEVEEAWRIIDAVKGAWAKTGGRDLPLYACGSMGPVESDQLLAKDGRYWIRPKELAT